MAGGHVKFRHLSRSSAHRQALLRNLVTALFQHEAIFTTWPKAKEAQRLAEKLVTLGKRNTDASRKRAMQIFYTPHDLVPKLFGPIRERYLERQGGYTRVLRIEPIKEDQAPSAILELVDSPVDMRFALTARTVSRQRRIAGQITDLTAMNVKKVTRYRPDGEAELEQLVKKFDDLATQGSHGVQIVEKKKMADPFRRPRYFDKTATRADWQRNVKDEKKRLEPILKMKNMEAEEDYDRLLAQEEQQWHKRYLPRQA